MPAAAIKTAVRVLVIPLEPADEPYAIIPLHGKYGQGLVAKVSLEDVARVRRYRWYADRSGYPITYQQIKAPKRTFKVFFLHRLILGLGKNDGRLADHRFGDLLDNRRSMLRECTHAQNSRNTRKSLFRESQYKGVSNTPSGLYRSAIGVDGQIYALGIYTTPEQAAEVYDCAARFHFGEFARTNFPGADQASVEQLQREYRLERLSKQACPYRGVYWRRGDVWAALIRHEKQAYRLGQYTTPEEAARVFDTAARYLLGVHAKTNFLGTEATSPDALVARYDEKFASSYLGVTKDSREGRSKCWKAQIKLNSEHYNLGSYTTPEEAAKVYDSAARFHWGGKAKTNFDGTETRSVEEIRVAVKVTPKRVKGTSLFYGVTWRKRNSKWLAQFTLEKGRRHIGVFDTEEDAARAYDDARAAHGLPRVNFPDQLQAA